VGTRHSFTAGGIAAGGDASGDDDDDENAIEPGSVAEMAVPSAARVRRNRVSRLRVQATAAALSKVPDDDDDGGDAVGIKPSKAAPALKSRIHRKQLRSRLTGGAPAGHDDATAADATAAAAVSAVSASMGGDGVEDPTRARLAGRRRRLTARRAAGVARMTVMTAEGKGGNANAGGGSGETSNSEIDSGETSDPEMDSGKTSNREMGDDDTEGKSQEIDL
jgi:hypothetical protein